MEVAKHEPATPIDRYFSTEACDVLKSTIFQASSPATFVLRQMFVLAASPNSF